MTEPTYQLLQHQLVASSHHQRPSQSTYLPESQLIYNQSALSEYTHHHSEWRQLSSIFDRNKQEQVPSPESHTVPSSTTASPAPTIQDFYSNFEANDVGQYEVLDLDASKLTYQATEYEQHNIYGFWNDKDQMRFTHNYPQSVANPNTYSRQGYYYSATTEKTECLLSNVHSSWQPNQSPMPPAVHHHPAADDTEHHHGRTPARAQSQYSPVLAAHSPASLTDFTQSQYQNNENHISSTSEAPQLMQRAFTVDRSPTSSVKTLKESALFANDPLSAEFKCYECNKTFSKRCYLTQHNNARHSRAKPFKCKRCGKRFSEPASLNEHFAKHADNKPYKCSQCSKSFNHKTDLRRHMYQHSGTKPYTCITCGKGFIREDHRLKHSNTHLRKNAEE